MSSLHLEDTVSFHSVVILSSDLYAAFLLGYLSHILADCLTFSGVPLLWPYRRKQYSPLPTVLHVRTDGRVEYVLTLVIIAGGLWVMRR